MFGEAYFDYLENIIYPTITEINENGYIYFEVKLHFQQDGNPPHYFVVVGQFFPITILKQEDR